MELNSDFDISLLHTMVGGLSSLDTPKLYIKSLDEAYSFLKSYGFDLHNPHDEKKLWYYHRRALVLLREKLLDPQEEIPFELADQKQLKDIRNLLLYASNDCVAGSKEKELQKWSCALLRVIHVFVHSENDLFSFFSEDIQNQILSPIQACVFHEGDKVIFKHPFSSEEITLKHFETKPFKTSASSVIKMLSKSDVVALKVLDKLGVRFITENLVDAFRLSLFLAERNIINFAHVIPDQSSNNLYPLNLFVESVKSYLNDRDSMLQLSHSADFEKELYKKWGEQKDKAILIRKENSFSDSEYRFIKFICRKLITINNSKGPFSFFYPFEIQIMDHNTYLKNQTGTSQHDLYKEKQRQAARKRVFPDLYDNANSSSKEKKSV